MQASAVQVFASFGELQESVGREIGCSAWLTVGQERIDQFAEATGDHQWIHVDPERALRESPYGATIAHGYLTLSLIPHFLREVFLFEPATAGINYGLDRVRFMSPVVVGSRLRGRLTLEEATRDEDGRVRVGWTITVEIEGQERPACIARTIALYLTR